MDDAWAWELQSRASGFACDPARGVVSATVAVRTITPWTAALLDHRFLRDREPALRTLDAAGMPKRSAGKTLAAAAAAAAAVGSKRSRADRDEEDDTPSTSCAFEPLL